MMIMKTKEELNALKEEVETMNKKLSELTGEELAKVFGGVYQKPPCQYANECKGSCMLPGGKHSLCSTYRCPYDTEPSNVPRPGPCPIPAPPR